MATPMNDSAGPKPARTSGRFRIRNNLLVLASLLLLIALQVAFVVNYSGFQDWQRIDANLLVFVAVNANIVLLTAVFYLILRHLFKLLYERKIPLAGVSLKTKLIVAFVALSLPSTAFHLTASGFIAQLYDSWTLGEYRHVLENARVVRGALDEMEHQALVLTAARIIEKIPRTRETFQGGDWLNGYHPELDGGIYIYDRSQSLVSRWESAPEHAGLWNEPPPEYFSAQDGFYWIERTGDKQIRRLLVHLADPLDEMTVEFMSVTPLKLSRAIMALEYKEASRAVVGRDLILLVLTILIGITLLIIFAATWTAFYLAKGFATPVEILADATRRVSKGELGYQVSNTSMGPLKRDFATLVDSFNLMSSQLKEQRLQLTQTAEDLRSSHQELGERNRFVELLLENIDLGIIAIDPTGNLTTVNRGAFRLLRLQPEQYRNRHYRDMLDREFSTLLDEMVARLRAGSSRPVRRNFTVTHHQDPTHIELTVLPLESEEGHTEGFVVMLEDVTDLQRTQRALAWREVARRVAHEIKNPLTPIQLSAQRIRRKYLAKLGKDADILDQCTQTIVTEVASLQKMVNEFAQFAQLPESKPTPGDLNTVIKEVARIYQTGLPENVDLKLELDENLPSLPLDREQLRRAFTNLIDNAAASIEGVGTITLRTAYQPDNQLIRAEVIDDGAGVPDEVRSRLFEPYTSTKEGGTGLGLTIVNQIVSDHNGFIRYSDRKPLGSIFAMEFRVP